MFSFSQDKVKFSNGDLGKGKALVELEDEECCEKAINFLNQKSPGMAFKSTTGNIKDGVGSVVDSDGNVVASDFIKRNSKIVKFVVKNSLYPICINNIYVACQSFGYPMKIATYASPDGAVHALIEFRTEQEAELVINGLNGK